MSVVGLPHTAEDYKFLHPLHGKSMHDTKAFKNLPSLPCHVSKIQGGAKKEIHDILSSQELEPKKERHLDKLPYVISELLKQRDEMLAREFNGKQKFDGSAALAQFIARRCKLKESLARPLVSVMREAGLLLETEGEGEGTTGQKKKQIMLKSTNELVEYAMGLPQTAKALAEEETKMVENGLHRPLNTHIIYF